VINGANRPVRLKLAVLPSVAGWPATVKAAGFDLRDDHRLPRILDKKVDWRNVLAAAFKSHN